MIAITLFCQVITGNQVWRNYKIRNFIPKAKAQLVSDKTTALVDICDSHLGLF